MVNIEKVENQYRNGMGVSYFDFLLHTDPSGVHPKHIEDPDADAFEFEFEEPDGTPIDQIFQH
tara:strand:- start:8982 stop:9170 length:189 start_codon:yes stop_codon:yes gene_type:complete